MLTQEQILKQMNNLVTCKSLANLEFVSRDIGRQIESAATIDSLTKSSLRNSLQTKTSQVEMGFIRNLNSRLKSLVDGLRNRLAFIPRCDYISLRIIENEVVGVANSFSWIEKEIAGISFPSVKNFLFELQKEKSKLVSLIESKKKEFKDFEFEEKKKKEAIAIWEKIRKEEEKRRKKEEEERRRREMQRRLQEPMQRRGHIPPIRIGLGDGD